MPQSARPDLLWNTRPFNQGPLWEYEPVLEGVAALCREKLNVRPDECDVSFLGEGCNNKVYLVQINGEKKYVMRMSLAVDPKYKTAGEVSTIEWLQLHTNVPVPKVISFDDSNKNSIGFEWIPMEYMPEQSAFYRWRKMSMDEKITVTKDVADCLMHMVSKSSFNGIGTLQGPVPHSPGRIVDMDLCYNDHYDLDIPRGPFHCTRDYFLTLIELTIPDWDAELDISLLNYEQSTAQTDQGYLDLAHRIRRLLPILFPYPSTSAEPTVLWHIDLNLRNIMLSGDNTLSGIIDWEFVSTLPFWAVTQLPKFLDGPVRDEKPDPDWYWSSPGQIGSDDGRDNEGKSRSYWRDLEEYEKTLLREVYNERMSQLNPDWEKLKREGRLCNDMREAIDCVSVG
ncbi:hypothetical protein NW752_008172 [Fusarium irregulare]|uniref:Aminoglycoside phosphotransferase domain-containing protein n=1 Tax=Fusarium irregulare TaxID=2494466 RepID=A0A9W8PX75_9HYPO|nr:hypothetical protein NW752_008172 [Fusarium irregulare]KAJ4019572.1 hypothetical protein NW766_003308 [Fusarium irregulare]